MVDFVLTRTGPQVDDVVTAGNNASATSSDTLLHSGNTSVVEYTSNIPDGSTEVINLGRGTAGLIDSARTTTAEANHNLFYNPNGEVGSIKTSGTATSFNTSSDPRLKNFVEAPTDSEINAMFALLHSCARLFRWKNDPDGEAVWGFDAHACVDAGLDIGSEGEGPRNLSLGDVYNVIAAVIEPQEVQVLYKTGEKKGEARLNTDGSPMMETVDVVVKEAIEEKVSPAGVDQAKAVPILLAKIEQLERRLVAAGL